jgi:hypothetical protein
LSFSAASRSVEDIVDIDELVSVADEDDELDGGGVVPTDVDDSVPGAGTSVPRLDGEAVPDAVGGEPIASEPCVVGSDDGTELPDVDELDDGRVPVTLDEDEDDDGDDEGDDADEVSDELEDAPASAVRVFRVACHALNSAWSIVPSSSESADANDGSRPS